MVHKGGKYGLCQSKNHNSLKLGKARAPDGEGNVQLL